MIVIFKYELRFCGAQPNILLVGRIFVSSICKLKTKKTEKQL